MNEPVQLKSRLIQGFCSGPQLLITGGIHGDEFEGMVAIRTLMNAIEPRNLRGSVLLVPVVNEAAFLRGSRVADDGLDLARICPGRIDGSITERIAFAVSQMIQSSDYYIDLHSGGAALCVQPLTGYTLHPDSEVLEKQRRMAKAFNLPLVWGTTSSLNGRTLSVARDAKVPAIYAEYLGCGLCSKQGISDYVEGCLNVATELGMIDRARPKSRVQRIVENSLPNSGHLQICHPAPMTGFFESAVTTGQHVRTSEVLGRITDLLGERTIEVKSEQSGTVVSVMTYSRVFEGDGLVAILEDTCNSG